MEISSYFCIPRRVDHPLGWSPIGCQIDLFLSYIFPEKSFFQFQFCTGNRPFLTPKFFYPPEGGPTNVVLYGAPI